MAICRQVNRRGLYTGQQPETPPSQPLPTLKKGSIGYWVIEAQLRLIAQG